MLTVPQALQQILEHVRPFPPERVPLNEALGLVLAEAVVSDTDSPPFDKALMDGFAVRAEDLAGGTATLRVVEEITAGRTPTRPVGPGEATQIMTGAPLPEGADAVVRVEETEYDSEAGTVHIRTEGLRPGTNLMRRATAVKRGDEVLPAGRLLRPQDLGALAEMGQYEIPVRRRPRVAVLATGDELVPIDKPPGPGQIRNSNETMLTAQIRRAGGEPVPLGIARDDRRHLRKKVETGLQCDVLLLSGGVSAGTLDLVPSELDAAGVKQVFHKVQVKPGKPLWFGIHPFPTRRCIEEQQRHGKVPSIDPDAFDPIKAARRWVFGLPGNPVSSMVCFELFVRPALRRLTGLEPAQPRAVRARLRQEHLAKGGRPTYHPARLQWNEDGPIVTPVRWHGSSDLRATVEANAMALFPAGEGVWQRGDRIDVYPWTRDDDES